MQLQPSQRSRHGAFLRQILLIVAVGIVIAAWLPRAPWVVPLSLVAIVSTPLAFAARRVAISRHTFAVARHWLLGCVLAGVVLYGYGVGLSQLSSRLPECITSLSSEAPLLMVADVVEPVRFRADRARLRLLTTSAIGGTGCEVPPGRMLDVSWFGAPSVSLGDRLTVFASLRPPRGLANPGAFDYERWLFAERVDGLGSIRSGTVASRSKGLLTSLRARAREAVVSRSLQYPGALLALSIGDAGLVPDEHWQRFRDTGTIHLMVISGLHIGIAYLLLLAISRALVSSLVLAGGVAGANALALASGLAWLGAGLLVALTGFSEPALRAWLMLAGYLVVRAIGRESNPLFVLMQVFAVVVLLRPLSVLSQGLWLSFFAVAVLLAFAPRIHGSWLRRLLLLQGLMALAMAPAIALFNGELVLTATFANTIAAPLASVVLVPLAMLSVLFATFDLPAANALLWLADVTVHILYALLESANAVAPIPLARSGMPRYALALLGVLLILLPLPWALRWLGGCAFALLLLPAVSGVQPGEFRLQVLDVGQGSAAIIDTAKHRVIVDAGYRSPYGFDMAEAVVIPAFLASGPRRLDLFVISHGDVDHAGGAPAVISALAPIRTLVGAGVEGPDERCQIDWRWRRDGVELSIIGAQHSAPNDNDGSCVVRVETATRSILLPGDISAREEFRLAQGGARPVDALVAAHHGSRSSSSARFLKALAPDTVIVSAGYANRFGHPHSDVLERVRAEKAAILRTDYDGAIRWHSATSSAHAHRSGYQPYWRAVSNR